MSTPFWSRSDNYYAIRFADGSFRENAAEVLTYNREHAQREVGDMCVALKAARVPVDVWPQAVKVTRRVTFELTEDELDASASA